MDRDTFKVNHVFYRDAIHLTDPPTAEMNLINYYIKNIKQVLGKSARK